MRAELATLLASVDNAEVQAVILFGPRSIGKSTLLHAAEKELAQVGNSISVTLNLRNNLKQSRAEIIRELASNTVTAVGLGVTGLEQSLLDDFSPNHFHQTFLEQVLQDLPPQKTLLFIFDDIDLRDRAQLSKLNNLLLPLLRRLAPLDRLKFVIAIDDIDLEKIQPLVVPIFASRQEIELTQLSEQDTLRWIQTGGIQTGGVDRPLDWSDYETLRQIWYLTAGQPTWIRKICTAVTDKIYAEDVNANAKTAVLPSAIQAVCSDVQIAIHSGMDWLWHTLSVDAQTYAIAIAANGTNVVAQATLQTVFDESSVQNVAQAIAELEERDLVETTADGISFRAGLLRQWIAETYVKPAIDPATSSHYQQPSVEEAEELQVEQANRPSKNRFLIGLLIVIIILLLINIWLLRSML